MIYIKRKEHESIGSLMRRFKKKLQQSRTLWQARKKRFYEPPKSKRQIREEARRRKELREQREYLKKIGRLEEKISPKFKR